MTILDQKASEAESNAPTTGAAAPERVTRPTLEREAPIRNWTTLFGPVLGASPLGRSPQGNTQAPGIPGLPGMLGATSQTLSDAVGQGYRVINEYLAQGQRQAEALRFPDWSSFLPNGAVFSANGAAPNNAQEAQQQQQLFRRFMQYGMDFAALWFEMASRMSWPLVPGGIPGAAAPGAAAPGAAAPGAAGAPGAVPAAWAEAFSRLYSPQTWAGMMPGPVPPAASPVSSETPGPSVRTPSQSEPARAATDGPERVLVSVVSECRVESTLELRRGSWSTLVAHALRPEGHDGPAIRGVTLDARPEESLLRVSVEVPADQAPGVYNGMLVDTASNLPRGTLTVRVVAADAE